MTVITQNKVTTKQSRDTTASVGNAAPALATPLALSKLFLKKSVTLMALIFGATVISRYLTNRSASTGAPAVEIVARDRKFKIFLLRHSTGINARQAGYGRHKNISFSNLYVLHPASLILQIMRHSSGSQTSLNTNVAPEGAETGA